MWGFAAIVTAIFFVLGGVALALPWHGVVAWAERRPVGADEASRRYVALLVAPVALVGVFVLSLLGPWDAAVCRQLHDACLERISGWRVPIELAVVLVLVAVLAVGRLAKPYLASHWTQPLQSVTIAASLDAEWQAVQREVWQRCGATPPMHVVGGDLPVCHLRGLVKPHMVVSVGLLRTLDHDELVGALCHEVAHWRRGDLPLGLLAYICHCLLFFMPTSRRCYRRYLEEREVAADDWAVAQTGKPLALAAALAKVGRAASASPGLVSHAAGGPLLQRRLERLIAPAPAIALPARASLARLLPMGLGMLAAGSLMALHLVLEGWGRGLLATLGVID